MNFGELFRIVAAPKDHEHGISVWGKKGIAPDGDGDLLSAECDASADDGHCPDEVYAFVDNGVVEPE